MSLLLELVQYSKLAVLFKQNLIKNNLLSYIEVSCIEGHICPVLFSPTSVSKLKTGQIQNKFLITVLIRKSIHHITVGKLDM